MSEKTIYDCERAKFEGFGTYKLPIEERVNEIMEATKIILASLFMMEPIVINISDES